LRDRGRATANATGLGGKEGARGEGGLSYDESVTSTKKRLYVGALVLEALVLAVLWLVGRHFSTL